MAGFKGIKASAKKIAKSASGKNHFAGKSGSAKTSGGKMHSKATSLSKSKSGMGAKAKHKP